ncbi:hypothetical protein FB45DRAFT_910198 [Roridomyces roridus]|uniref:Secreted protein n=1 Tax=Roridomyces roridus TaxID=1738132 RepID=A0AAD7BZD8_9AGAR|nr:hypothetical protein FB45DRAFT_910198 [Roridomyces roridus]
MTRSKLRTAVAFLPFLFSLSWATLIVDTIKAKALTCEPVLLQWQGGKSESSWFPPRKHSLTCCSLYLKPSFKYRSVRWRACRDPRSGH